MAVPCVKNHYGRTYFDEFMLTCLRGAVFLDTVYFVFILSVQYLITLLQPNAGRSKASAATAANTAVQYAKPAAVVSKPKTHVDHLADRVSSTLVFYF